MNKSLEYVMGFITVKDDQEAQKIARGLLQEKLVACVNVIDSVHSFFLWQGRMDEAKEVLLIIKTRTDVMDQVIKTVKLLHSYETPEIIAFPIISGSQDYLNWIDSSVSVDGKEIV